MPPTVYIFIFLVIAFTLYFWTKSKMQEKVYKAEAAPTNGLSKDDSWEDFIFARPAILRLKNGETVPTSKFIRIRIQGSCMEPKGIIAGEQWFVKPISQSKILDEIKPGDVLLIHLKDKNMYKIREYQSTTPDATSLNTFYYNPDGTPHQVYIRDIFRRD